MENNTNRLKLFLLGGISSIAWLCYFRSRRSSRRPNIQPPEPCNKENGYYTQLSKGRTFYRFYNEHCSSKLPPIVLCHGFMGSSEYLIPLIEALLPTQRRIYALDLYGRGHSDCVDDDYNYDLFTEQISELLDALAISSPIDLVGYSMGGGIVVQFGAHNLPFLRSLTLIAPVGLPSMTVGPSSSLKLILKLLKYCSYTLYGGYLHEWLTAKVLQPSDEIIGEGWSRVDTSRFQWYKKHMLRRFANEKNTLPRAVASTLLNLPFDSLSESYGAIGNGNSNSNSNSQQHMRSLCTAEDATLLSPRVLVMWGENDQAVPCDRDGVQRHIPQAQILTWPNEGHMLPVELAEEVGEKILEFWQPLEET